MTTVKTAVRDLKPGDVLDDTDREPFVVLYLEHDAGGAYLLQLGRLGPLPRDDDRVLCVGWAPEAMIDVKRPDLTPAQAVADLLLGAVGKAVEIANAAIPDPICLQELRREWAKPAEALLRQARPKPPEPPTLVELAEALDKICNEGAVGPQLNAAEKLLHRARAAGVLP